LGVARFSAIDAPVSLVPACMTGSSIPARSVTDLGALCYGIVLAVGDRGLGR
jgi:hypothetical protein